MNIHTFMKAMSWFGVDISTNTQQQSAHLAEVTDVRDTLSVSCEP